MSTHAPAFSRDLTDKSHRQTKTTIHANLAFVFLLALRVLCMSSSTNPNAPSINKQSLTEPPQP
jgi:hypothetical protein